MSRAKLAVEKLVERVGFVGILLCASVRNVRPLRLSPVVWISQVVNCLSLSIDWM